LDDFDCLLEAGSILIALWHVHLSKMLELLSTKSADEPKSGQSHLPWAANMRRTQPLGDFTRWKEHDEYQKGLKGLLRDPKQKAINDKLESDAGKD